MKISSEDLFLRREAVGFNWRKFYPWEELSVTERSPKWDRMDSVDYIYMKYNINTRKYTWDDRELRPPFQSVHCIGFSGYIHIDYRTFTLRLVSMLKYCQITIQNGEDLRELRIGKRRM